MPGSKTGGGKGTNQYQVKGASQQQPAVVNDAVASGNTSAAASSDDPFAQPKLMSPSHTKRKEAAQHGLDAQKALAGRTGLSAEQQKQQLVEASGELGKAVTAVNEALVEGGHGDKYHAAASKSDDLHPSGVNKKLLSGSGTTPRKLRKAARSYAQAGARTLEGRSAMTEEEKGMALTTAKLQFAYARNLTGDALSKQQQEDKQS